ncbi:hypothetical protein Ddye_018768 [Dipteronia dyeriana]|uniref:Seed maturation protein n=1 Tax=Dipteronia dyeriana TaxID=168575 RepID=A0AAD9UBR4_9ROSI|nr:hypothetical protein Ddye_018768 [Dipteronia dyeriana]
MAKSKDDIKYGTAQAKLSEDEMLRVNYKHGTPLEAGKIADSQPVDLFSAAHNISNNNNSSSSDQSSVHPPQSPPQPQPQPSDQRHSGRHNVNSSG